MRLGGPLEHVSHDPGGWVDALSRWGYRAAYCPVDHTADKATIQAYLIAAEKADIVIAEVGAWSNPLSSDEATRTAAVDLCKKRLALAEAIGARCCVNIAGSRGAKWDGPDAADLTEATFEMIVESVRGIIDAVKPKRTFYTLETMPWMYPDSTASYQRLIEAIDRRAFGVHFDPVNLINSPDRYFNNGAVVREFIATLGGHIKSCHAKDIRLGQNLTVHLDECRPGAGELDYRVLLRGLDSLGPDVPVMLEHLSEQDDYAQAGEFIRSLANQIGVIVL